MKPARHFAGYDGYVPGNAYFTCDRCGFRYRRSQMLTEWTGLKVDARCLDPRPPQMQPPNVYPEGIPFFDARPPGDRPDRLVDDTTLRPILGGVMATVGDDSALYDSVLDDSGGQAILDNNLAPINVTPVFIPSRAGLLSPQPFYQTPVELSPLVLADDVTFITGPVAAPSVET